MSQAIALDELAVGSPLLLELRQGRGIHHGAGGLKLMDVHVDQARLPPPVRQKDLSLCIPYLILPNALVKLERVSPIKCSSRRRIGAPPLSAIKPSRICCLTLSSCSVVMLSSRRF